VALSVTLASASNMPGQSLVTDALLDAIARKESNNNPAAVGDTHLANQAYGAFQVRLPAFQDVQRVFPDQFGQVTFEQMQRDPALNRAVAKAYLLAGEQAYGITELPRLISFYNRGPKARSGPITNQSYVNDVQQFLRAPTGDPPVKPTSRRTDQPFRTAEEAVTYLNRMVVSTDLMAPLTAQEIEPMLSRFSPPTAMPGVHPTPPDAQAQERTTISALAQAQRQRGMAPQGAGAALATDWQALSEQGGTYMGQPVPPVDQITQGHNAASILQRTRQGAMPIDPNNTMGREGETFFPTVSDAATDNPDRAAMQRMMLRRILPAYSQRA